MLVACAAVPLCLWACGEAHASSFHLGDAKFQCQVPSSSAMCHTWHVGACRVTASGPLCGYVWVPLWVRVPLSGCGLQLSSVCPLKFLAPLGLMAKFSFSLCKACWTTAYGGYKRSNTHGRGILVWNHCAGWSCSTLEGG